VPHLCVIYLAGCAASCANFVGLLKVDICEQMSWQDEIFTAANLKVMYFKKLGCPTPETMCIPVRSDGHELFYFLSLDLGMLNF
jgi:hypothetical protein